MFKLLTPNANSTEIKSFTDVLYMSSHKTIPFEVKRLLKQKSLSYTLLPIDKFHTIRDRMDLIGTVIIEAQDTETTDNQNLAQLIESFELEGVGVILLTQRIERHMRSFSLAPTDISFSMTDRLESFSIGELWAQISINLAYRRKSTGITAKPALPSQRAVKLSNNKLAGQLETTVALIENLSEQLRTAGVVQRDFLPSSLPNSDKIHWAAMFLPAEWVSGDIYDVVRVDEEHIGFYIADAVGHSMPAALLTIFIKQALVMREITKTGYKVFTPMEVISRLNKRMTHQKLSGYQFATSCYCLLNTETLHLTFCRAGHPYPILIRKGQPPQQLQSRGSLLGIFENSEFVQSTVQLQPGDKLILYSDGAEPFIGRVDNQAGFNLTKQFEQITHLPITDMIDKFNLIVKNSQITEAEIDDITLVGMEVLENKQ